MLTDILEFFCINIYSNTLHPREDFNETRLHIENRLELRIPIFMFDILIHREIRPLHRGDIRNRRDLIVMLKIQKRRKIQVPIQWQGNVFEDFYIGE